MDTLTITPYSTVFSQSLRRETRKHNQHQLCPKTVNVMKKTIKLEHGRITLSHVYCSVVASDYLARDLRGRNPTLGTKRLLSEILAVTI